MKLLSGKFEAKKHAYRQTQDGVVISFVVHPNDMTPELAHAPLGTQLMIAYQEFTDEPPPRRGDGYDNHTPKPKNGDRSEAGKARYAMADEMERAMARAAMLCAEPLFQDWLVEHENVGPWHPGLSLVTRKARTAEVLRNALNIPSRKELAFNVEAFEKFQKLELAFSQHAGRFAKVDNR